MMEMGNGEGTSNGEGAECGEGVKCLKREPVSNGCGFEGGNDSGEGSSGASENIRTYKRRRQLRSSSKIKVQDNGRTSTAQACLPGTDNCASLNISKARPCRQWRNVVLEQMHQIVSGDHRGIEPCIQDALYFHSENGSNVSVKESDASQEDRQKCPLQVGRIPNGTKDTVEELEGVANGSLRENPQTTNEICRRILFDVMISEKFTSLCKLLNDRFEGIKHNNVFLITAINTKMIRGVYEHYPWCFAQDMELLFGRLERFGTEIVSLAKSLNNLSSTSYNELIGVPHPNAELLKHKFNQEPESLAKPEQTEACGVYKVCSCRHCGEKADGKDCLVCDSCEEMYHVACIEPAVKEIPPRSWYCAKCTANGMGSPHENCVICERLNDPRTLHNNDADENHNANSVTELEEHSNCSVDDGLQLSPGHKNLCVCKICGIEVEKGEELRTCEHPYCPNKYYHVRCLTMKQLKSYSSHWYCPSCLCRTCLIDKDDDKIVLCDGCDAAYHIYCMKPPRTSIPRGKWFCRECDAGIQRIRRAKRAYLNLENKLKMKGLRGKMAYDNPQSSQNQKDREESDKSRGGVDMLLTAANTLSFEEKLAAIQTKN